MTVRESIVYKKTKTNKQKLYANLFTKMIIKLN